VGDAMTAAERSQLPAIVCTPWCEYQDGHPESFSRDEQTCWGPAAYAEFSLEDVHRDRSGVYLPRIGAMAYRQWPGAAPCVTVHLDAIRVAENRGGDCLLDESLELTADEAIRLATALLKAAEDVQASGAKR
jgi:hypothetical protein